MSKNICHSNRFKLNSVAPVGPETAIHGFLFLRKRTTYSFQAICSSSCPAAPPKVSLETNMIGTMIAGNVESQWSFSQNLYCKVTDADLAPSGNPSTNVLRRFATTDGTIPKSLAPY